MNTDYLKSFDRKEKSFGWIFGSPYAYIYLIDDILFDSSVSAWAYIFCKEGKDFKRLFLTHSHYDHLGGAWVIKEFYPNINIYGHSYIENVFKSLNALNIITNYNKLDSEEIINYWSIPKEYIDFKIFNFDYVFNFTDEGILYFDDFWAIYTPGHTKDTVSFYITKYNALVMSESMGIPNYRFNFVLPEFLTSYKLYLGSFEKLKKLVLEKNVNNFLLPHIMYFEYFSDVKDFIKLSEESLKFYVKSLINFIEKAKIEKDNLQTSKLEEIFNMVLDSFYYKYELIQPLYGFKANVTAQIKNIIKELI